MLNYSAKLLFQFKRLVRGRAMKIVLCEERIVAFTARRPAAALAYAKKVGRCEEHDYYNGTGEHVFFEFLGVMDLRDMTMGADGGEVWYEFVERVEPRKRLRKLVPPESELHALRRSIPRKRRLA